MIFRSPPWLMIAMLGFFGGSAAAAAVGDKAAVADPSLQAEQADRITIEHAWLRAAPPSVDVHAAYLTLRNPGDRGIRLIGAVAAQARAVEIHTTRRNGDQLRMQRLRWVAVPPAQSVAFRSGGHHLMLFGLSPAPRTGDRVNIDLLFDDNSHRTVEFPVYRSAPAADANPANSFSHARSSE